MIITYATQNTVIHLSVIGTMTAGIRRSLSSMVKQSTATTIRQPSTKFIPLILAGPVGEISQSTSMNLKSLLSQTFKTKFCPASI